MIPKFRAWNKKTQSFINYGDLVLDLRTGKIFAGDIGLSESTIDVTDQIVLTQSTGLSDKNGTEIYEGDIVHILDSEQINQRDENGAYIDAFFEEIDEIDSVVFVDGYFKLKRTGFDVCICRSVEDFKIIGNIYENPELLEVE